MRSESRNRLIRIGVIGCGRVAGTKHLPALARLPDAKVVAVGDIVPERLRGVADRFGIEQRHTDFRTLLDNHRIDAVAVCVPAQFHAEVALAALDAGKHLLIEKPLALSLDESDRIIKRAARSACKVMVGFNLRWHRLVRRARDIIRRGDLGPLELVRTVFTSGTRLEQDSPEWRQRRDLGGGVLSELAVHHIDLWRFLLESEVEEVFATSRSAQWDDEAATISWQMANGVLGTSLFSQGTCDTNEMDVYGEAGRLHVSCYRFDGLQILPRDGSPGDIGFRVRGVLRTLRELPRAAISVRQGGDFGASYRGEWRHFLDSIKEETPLQSTLQDGHRSLQVVLAAMASVSQGRPVKVALAPRVMTPIASGPRLDRQ